MILASVYTYEDLCYVDSSTDGKPLGEIRFFNEVSK